ncbi:MAG: hypothetical protein K2Q10_05885, partial [Rhodospirillales bacterium]|nr:hypothetical protein [Rhodospirillales bacterium]
MKAWSHLDPRLDPYADEDHSTRIRIARIPGAARTRVQDRERGLSVIILTLDKPELIIPLARDLAAQVPFFAARGLGLEILIGDTGSTDPRLLAFYENLPAGIRV